MLGAEPPEVARTLGGDSRAARHLAVVRSILAHSLRMRTSSRPVLGNTSSLLAYLRLDMAFDGVEAARILFLDGAWRLIREETMWRGTVDAVPVYVREVLRRAIELRATSLVLAHNHPSGDPSPTSADVKRTRELQRGAAQLGVELHDHVIVGEFGAFSMRRAGMLAGA